MTVASAECERSFSTLTRLKTYLRATMEQFRLSSLALISIHQEVEILPEEIVKIFMSKGQNHRVW